MPVFLGVHDMGEPLDETKFKAGWAKYKVACQKHGAEAWKVFYNAEKGKAFCLTQAGSAKEVHGAHEDVGVPLKEVIEVEKLK